MLVLLLVQALARSIAARESQVHLLQRNNTALQTAHSKAQSTMVDLCWELQKLLDQASKRTAMQQHVALERLFQRFSASKDPPSISAYADEVSLSWFLVGPSCGFCYIVVDSRLHSVLPKLLSPA